MASVAGIFRVKLLKTEGTYKLTQMCQTKPDPRKSSSLHDKGTEEKLYGVRLAAYETFKAWNVDVQKPVVRDRSKK